MTPDEALARLDIYRERSETRDEDVRTALLGHSQQEVRKHSGLSRQWIARIAAGTARKPKPRPSWWQCRYCGHRDESPDRTAEREQSECLAHEADCPQNPRQENQR